MIFDASVSEVILGLRFGVLHWLRPAVQLGLRMQPVIDEKRCRSLVIHTGPLSGGTTDRKRECLSRHSALWARLHAASVECSLAETTFGWQRTVGDPRSSDRDHPVGCAVSRERIAPVGGSPFGVATTASGEERPSGRAKSVSTAQLLSGSWTRGDRTSADLPREVS